MAATGFDAEAEAYDRARPPYPEQAVAWLADRLDLGPGRLVVDLAAGTGKLTGVLAHWPARVIAIEPVAGMRLQLHRSVPDVPVLAGVAEALPLADGSVDAVTVAQAFHWFDAPRALTELARVVRVGGRLALLWNARDRSVDWVDQIWSVMDRVERQAPWRDHGDGTADPHAAHRWREDAIAGTGQWSGFERTSFWHVHQVTPEQVVDRIRSVSHVAVLPDDDKAAVLAEVRAILRDHPATRDAEQVGLRYRLDLLVSQRLEC